MSSEPPRSSKRIWLIGAVILLSAATLIFALLWFQARSVEPAEVTTFLSQHDEKVAEIAEGLITAIVTYTPETVEAQADAIRENATGQFLEDYEELISGGLGEVVEETAATSQGEIATGPDIAFVSAERATAVARVVQEVSTRGDVRERTIFSVMRLSLVLEDGMWRADALEILSQNSL